VSMARILATAAAAAAFTLLLVPLASATTNNYWGYNNISSTNPPAGTCTIDGSAWPAGFACSGWNYWDYSQIDRASSSGGEVRFGFRFTSIDAMIFANTTTGGTYTRKWDDPIFSPYQTHYNRAMCSYGGGNRTYVQCRALIF
jgi:hypothetical protein